MHLIFLSLLLFTSWPALAAPRGGFRLLSSHQDKADSNVLGPPQLTGYNAASCSHASTNIFKDHGLVPQQTLPEPFRGNPKLADAAPRVLSARAYLRLCRQLGSFKFDPVAQRQFSIDKIELLPGSLYVLSVASNTRIQYLSAFSLGLASPHRQSLVDAEPYENVGELHVSVDEPSEVFFLTVFQSQYAQGEIALFSIGPGELGEG